MTTPCSFRICGKLPGESPVEFVRVKGRHYLQADWDYWTRDLLDRWSCWVERPMRDSDTITARPGTTRTLATIAHVRVRRP